MYRPFITLEEEQALCKESILRTFFDRDGLVDGNGLTAQRFALPASARGADKARKRNPAEALKTAKKRAESQPSGARRVGRFRVETNQNLGIAP